MIQDQLSIEFDGESWMLMYEYIELIDAETEEECITFLDKFDTKEEAEKWMMRVQEIEYINHTATPIYSQE